MRRSRRRAPTTAGTWAAGYATPAPCTPTSGPAPAPNSPTAATSAIIPVGGWWKDNNRKDRVDLPVRYALLVSLRTDAVATDIYTPIAAQIGIPVPIST